MPNYRIFHIRFSSLNNNKILLPACIMYIGYSLVHWTDEPHRRHEHELVQCICYYIFIGGVFIYSTCITLSGVFSLTTLYLYRSIYILSVLKDDLVHCICPSVMLARQLFRSCSSIYWWHGCISSSSNSLKSHWTVSACASVDMILSRWSPLKRLEIYVHRLQCCWLPIWFQEYTHMKLLSTASSLYFNCT
jgi:hypothetical protein